MTSPTQIRTLVVDDSEFFAEMTADTLENEHDIAAVAETDPRRAIALVENREFDCIISDYEMPEMDGLTFLQEVRDRSAEDIPFILLTGRGDEETASEAIAAGVADYLLKLEVVEDKQYERLANRVESVVNQHRAQQKYELLVTNTPDAIAQVTVDGQLVAVNPAMAEFFTDDRDELLGQHLSSVLPEDVAETRLDAGREVVETGELARTEDAHDGRFFHNIFVPVDFHSDEDTFQMISRDITERKERERELHRQNERLEKFASVVSHDLRNPLTVARGALELLEDDADDDATEKLDRSLDRMSDIIEDVLTLAKKGETVHDPSPVSLETVAEDAWSYVEGADATLVVDSSAELSADDGRLQELLGNLFRNSVEHGSTGSRSQAHENSVEHGGDGVTITVTTTEDGFSVTDDGPGIPESDRENVFEMGYSTAPSGTGLGLSIVQQIAEAHGWTVSLAESDDGGTRVDVTGVEFVDAE